MREETFTLILRSVPAEFAKLEEFVEQISDNFNIGHTYFSNIIVTLTELVRNAMIHGNRNNPEKKIIIYLEQTGGNLVFSVKDQGDGFSFPLPEPGELLFNPNIHNGLSIVQSLSDELEFIGNGSEIKVSFHIASANKLLSLSRINTLTEEFREVKKNKSLNE